MITRRSLVNFGWLSLVNIMWATQFPAYKLAVTHMSVSALSLYTFLLALLLLAPFLLRQQRSVRKAQKASSSRKWWLELRSWLFLGFFGLLPPSILMSWGIEGSSSSNAAILTLTIPILMLVLAVPMLGERLTWTRISTLLLALLGTVLVSRDDLVGGVFNWSSLAGTLVIFAACAGSAFYNIYLKKLLDRYTELQVLVYGYAVAAVLCAGVSLCFDSRPFYDVAGVPISAWIGVLMLGALTWGISMVLFIWLLKRVDIAQVSVSIYLLSFFGVLLSAIVLGEQLRPAQLIGGLIVATATLFADAHERSLARSATAV